MGAGGRGRGGAAPGMIRAAAGKKEGAAARKREVAVGNCVTMKSGMIVRASKTGVMEDVGEPVEAV